MDGSGLSAGLSLSLSLSVRVEGVVLWVKASRRFGEGVGKRGSSLGVLVAKGTGAAGAVVFGRSDVAAVSTRSEAKEAERASVVEG